MHHVSNAPAYAKRFHIGWDHIGWDHIGWDPLAKSQPTLQKLRQKKTAHRHVKNDIEPSTGWPIDSISMCERMDPNWCKNEDLALERPRRTKINPSRQGKRTQCQAYMLLCPRVQKLMRNSCNTCRMDGGHMHSPLSYKEEV